MTADTLRIVSAQWPAHLETVRGLMREYQSQLGLDLAFQDFTNELQQLPGAYGAPRGRLLLALRAAPHEEAVGCVALRDRGNERAEMKRLYVRPSARGAGIAARLVLQLIDEARSAGYHGLVLDTLPTMQAAQRLYASCGFVDIAPYWESPVPGTRYLGLDLDSIALPYES